MTRKADLKRRVRARQARTAETYTAALQNVLAARAVPVLELVDLTEAAAALGLRCLVRAFPNLPVDHHTVLTRLRNVLDLTADDPGMDLMRAVLLRGLAPQRPLDLPQALRGADDFMARARAQIGGVSASGRSLAFAAGAHMLLAVIWALPSPLLPARPPFLVIRPVLPGRRPSEGDPGGEQRADWENLFRDLDLLF